MTRNRIAHLLATITKPQARGASPRSHRIPRGFVPVPIEIYSNPGGMNAQTLAIYQLAYQEARQAAQERLLEMLAERGRLSF